jgi:hypothetical protein
MDRKTALIVKELTRPRKPMRRPALILFYVIIAVMGAVTMAAIVAMWWMIGWPYSP